MWPRELAVTEAGRDPGKGSCNLRAELMRCGLMPSKRRTCELVCAMLPDPRVPAEAPPEVGRLLCPCGLTTMRCGQSRG